MALILASTSAIRRALLDAAGVAHIARPPAFDEAAAKRDLDAGGETLARRLAEGKAMSLASAADDWVIGADSVVEVEGRQYSKPRDRAEAAAHLAAFSGRTMTLSSAAALAQGGRIAWSLADSARLAVRPLSSGFIDAYLDVEWPAVGHCVGVFRMEGRGAQLFESIDGSHFTILGLPLLPLLGALRARGILMS